MLARVQPESGSGFTLVELVVAIVILGVVAAIAGPRLVDTTSYDSRGFSDEVRSALRYAQKVAIAQRRSVCADFFPDRLELVFVAGGGCNAALPVRGAGDSNPFVVTAPRNVTVTATDFAFNGLGQPVTPAGVVLGAPQLINVTGRVPIIVEPETGYVR